MLKHFPFYPKTKSWLIVYDSLVCLSIQRHSLHNSDVLTAEPREVDASERDGACLKDVEGAYVLGYLRCMGDDECGACAGAEEEGFLQFGVVERGCDVGTVGEGVERSVHAFGGDEPFCFTCVCLSACIYYGVLFLHRGELFGRCTGYVPWYSCVLLAQGGGCEPCRCVDAVHLVEVDVSVAMTGDAGCVCVEGTVYGSLASELCLWHLGAVGRLYSYVVAGNHAKRVLSEDY